MLKQWRIRELVQQKAHHVHRKRLRRRKHIESVPQHISPPCSYHIHPLHKLLRCASYLYQPSDVRLLVWHLSRKRLHRRSPWRMDHLLSISDPMNRRCFGSSMHVFTVANSPAQQSTTTCPGFEDLLKRFFTHGSQFFSAVSPNLF